MKYIPFLLLVFAFAKAKSQQNAIPFTAQEIIEKSIAFHDPNNNWPTFVGEFKIKTRQPEKLDRLSSIQINLPEEKFALVSTTAAESTSYYVHKDSVSVVKSGKMVEQMSNTDRDRALLMKDYYTYLYGLPMKLADEGTIVHEQVKKVWFWNINAYKVKVTYTQEVGSDVWYFYFDPENFELKAYQFFKTDANGKMDKDSGEYILLSDSVVINGIKIPADRSWYYNKNTLFIAADKIVD
jgi:hypothetical protein